MSFGFRERVKRDKPRLSDRFRGKSGEEIVEELRKDFAKRKQMFFDTAPRTPDFMKPEFPFDDTSRWRNRGDSDLRHRLDEIAQRYPEFADQLRDWTSKEESPSGMGWGSKQAQSQPSTPQQAGQAPQPEAAPATTQQPPAQPAGPDGDARTQRAMSAPPDNRAKEQPQRFVSRLEINPTGAPEETAQQPAQPAQPQPANPQQQPQPQAQQPQAQQPQAQQPQAQQSGQPEPKKASNVRHIPIFVEDRNETVMPRADVDSTTADFGKSFGSPPRERDSRDREDGFHGPAYAKYAPTGFGFMNKPWGHSYQRSSPFMSREPMHGSPPQHQQHFPHQQQHPPQHQQPHHSQQQQHPQHSHPQAHSQHHPQQPQHHPQQPQQQHPHPQQPHPEPARQQTPPRQLPPKPKDPLEEVAAVQKDVDELTKQVEAFAGKRQDKQYIYLDEMLTRNLLKLDLVETEGRENVRAARKETIKCIQKCISMLESKTMTPEELAEREKAMEVDPEPLVDQPMEVASKEGEPAAVAEATNPADPAPSSTPVPSATPAPEAPSEPAAASAAAPAPAQPPASTDAPSAPAAEPMEADSQTSPAVNPEVSAQEATAPTTAPVSHPPAEAATAPAAAS